MQIFIPSSNRAYKQTTFDNLPAAIKGSVHLVVPQEQIHEYKEAGYDPVWTPDKVRGIGATRQWICDEFGGHILMLDDDLIFAKRREDAPDKFREPTEVELIDLFYMLEQLMTEAEWVHGAVAPREGGNRNTELYITNTRCLRALFYNADVLKKEKIKFTDMEVMEDFHVALSLLRAGHPSISVNWMVQNQNGSNLPGGCSVYRTPEVQARAAHALKEKHPDFVTVVTKTTKTAWGGETRTDVRVAWKAAHRAGVARATAKEPLQAQQELF